MPKSKYQQLVERRLSADTAPTRVGRYLEELYNSNDKAARQFRTSSARDSVNGTVALDLAGLTFGVVKLAADAGDLEVAETSPKEIQDIIVTERKRLFLTAQGNRTFMASLAKAEEAKGLKNTAGEA